MKKIIIVLMAAVAVVLISPKANAQFQDFRTVTQIECWVSTVAPTMCIDLASAPYSRLVFGSYMLYGDTTTINATIRVAQSSPTIATAGLPLQDERIRWASFDQAQLIFKDKIWAFAQNANVKVKLLIGVGRP